jgi:hypothetical protein
MTLDDLINALCDLRQQNPSAGTATVSVKHWSDIDWSVRYDLANVWLFDEEMTALYAPPEPPPRPQPTRVRTRRQLRDSLRVIRRRD